MCRCAPPYRPTHLLARPRGRRLVDHGLVTLHNQVHGPHGLRRTVPELVEQVADVAQHDETERVKAVEGCRSGAGREADSLERCCIMTTRASTHAHKEDMRPSASMHLPKNATTQASSTCFSWNQGVSGCADGVTFTHAWPSPEETSTYTEIRVAFRCERADRTRTPSSYRDVYILLKTLKGRVPPLPAVSRSLSAAPSMGM